MKAKGVKIERDARGQLRRVTIDVKKHPRMVEDFLDNLVADEAIEEDDFVPWEDVRDKLEKKHGQDLSGLPDDDE
ncbi:MAG: hypothetical protein WBA12_06895 [Catalinimonas sp.]